MNSGPSQCSPSKMGCRFQVWLVRFESRMVCVCLERTWQVKFTTWKKTGTVNRQWNVQIWSSRQGSGWRYTFGSCRCSGWDGQVVSALRKEKDLRTNSWLAYFSVKKNQKKRWEGADYQVGGESGEASILETMWRNCLNEEVLVQGVRCYQQVKWDEGWELAIERSNVDQCGIGVKRVTQSSGHEESSAIDSHI